MLTRITQEIVLFACKLAFTFNDVRVCVKGEKGGAEHMCLPYNVNAWQPSKLCNNQIQRTHDTISGLHMRSHFIASSIHPANKAADYRAHRRRWRCNNHFGYHH